MTKVVAKRYKIGTIRQNQNQFSVKDNKQLLETVNALEKRANNVNTNSNTNNSINGGGSAPIIIVEKNERNNSSNAYTRVFNNRSRENNELINSNNYNDLTDNLNNQFDINSFGSKTDVSNNDNQEYNNNNNNNNNSRVLRNNISIANNNSKNTLKENTVGVDINNLEIKTVRVRKTLTTSDFIKKNIKYPLTPVAPKKGEKIFAWANIVWDDKANAMMYNVIEPVVSPQDKIQIDKIKTVIEQEIDVDFKSFSKDSSKSYIESMIDKIVKHFDMAIDVNKFEIYKYYIIRDFVGLGVLQPILNDSHIEDISCDGVGISMFIFHRDPTLGSLQTNVIFKSNEELDTLVMRIAQKCGRSISMAEPLFQGSLPDGSRVQATLATDIASKGSNITIRRFLNEPLTPVHLLNYGTMDSRILAYLWLAIEHGKSLLIVGSTASGKTSLLNALSMFIKPSAKVVSIEDTPEIKLSHEHWVPEISRSGFGEAKADGHRRGEVSMFDLLKGSLRQRPDFIIVGEIRGIEASVFFQQIATGHPGLSTFHADSLEKVIDRLTTRPINLSKSLLETLDLLVFAKRLKIHDGYVRRVTEVQEISGYDAEKDQILNNKVFNLDPFEDKFEVSNDSLLLGKISSESGITINQLKNQLLERMNVLEWMSSKYITHYKRVNEVIKAYYTDSVTLMELIKDDSGGDADVDEDQ